MKDNEQLILETPSEIHPCIKTINCPREPLTGVPVHFVTDFENYILKDSSEKANTPNRNENEFFSQTSTSKADASLVADLNELKLTDTIDETIMTSIHQADYNAALRNACYLAKDPRIITTILQHRNRLKIDVTEKSKNSNRNAIHWLKLNVALADNVKEDIMDELLQASEQTKNCSII
jgi:hypothetical protein